MLAGQGVEPAAYHPLADQIGVEDLGEYMETLELLYRREAQAMPPHADLIARHCAARP